MKRHPSALMPDGKTTVLESTIARLEEWLDKPLPPRWQTAGIAVLCIINDVHVKPAAKMVNRYGYWLAIHAFNTDGTLSPLSPEVPPPVYARPQAIHMPDGTRGDLADKFAELLTDPQDDAILALEVGGPPALNTEEPDDKPSVRRRRVRT